MWWSPGLTSIIIFKKCSKKPSSGGQECYIQKTHQELAYLANGYVCLHDNMFAWMMISYSLLVVRQGDASLKLNQGCLLVDLFYLNFVDNERTYIYVCLHDDMFVYMMILYSLLVVRQGDASLKLNQGCLLVDLFYLNFVDNERTDIYVCLYDDMSICMMICLFA